MSGSAAGRWRRESSGEPGSESGSSPVKESNHESGKVDITGLIALKFLRKEIDAVDGELIRLLSRRLRLCEEVGGLKAAESLPVQDPRRERAVLEAVESQVGDPALKPYVVEIYRAILEESRRLQSEGRS